MFALNWFVRNYSKISIITLNVILYLLLYNLEMRDSNAIIKESKANLRH